MGRFFSERRYDLWKEFTLSEAEVYGEEVSAYIDENPIYQIGGRYTQVVFVSRHDENSEGISISC